MILSSFIFYNRFPPDITTSKLPPEKFDKHQRVINLKIKKLEI